MARQRISLVPDEVKKELDLESKIKSGEINAENFSSLDPDTQDQVRKILFQMASSKVEPNQGASALEFVVFAFMRIALKTINGVGLTAEDLEIKESLDRILDMHQITNQNTYKSEWLFDYLEYAEEKTKEILANRKEHIQRKLEVTGHV